MIDDDSNLRGLARAYFKKEEFVFSEAASGPLGLESARLQKPDIIIIDMMMQEMSGIEVIKKLQKEEETKRIPVIVLTGFNYSARQISTIEKDENVEVVVKKPFVFDELRAIIDSILVRSARSEKAP